jgi:predicted enzyme related to lactoylglutathione lyase
MSNPEKNEAGVITWTDLTVENAEEVRNFYHEVVGWKFSPENMGDYNDFNMITPNSGTRVAGICHARGMNADIPPQWLVYINVADIDKSIAQCNENGGKVLVGPKDLGSYRHYCVIQDPAGAVAALISPPKK